MSELLTIKNLAQVSTQFQMSSVVWEQVFSSADVSLDNWHQAMTNKLSNQIAKFQIAPLSERRKQCMVVQAILDFAHRLGGQLEKIFWEDGVLQLQFSWNSEESVRDFLNGLKSFVEKQVSEN